MSPHSTASKVAQVVVCLPLCREHTDVTSVPRGLTGKLTPLYLVSHRAQLLPRPGLKYHQHPPCPAIFRNVLLGCCLVAKSCPTLCNPMNYSLQGFSVLHLSSFHCPKARGYLECQNNYSHWNLMTMKYTNLGFPNALVGKNPPANARDTGLIPGPGRSHMPAGK